MKHLTFNHIYDCYPLYQVTHARPAGYRTTEMQGLNMLLDYAAAVFPKATSSLKGIHVYELLAGAGEYQDAWDHLHTLGQYPMYDSWYSVEGVEQAIPIDNQYIEDVTTFVPPTDHNLLLSPYYGLDSVLDLTTPGYVSTSEAIAAAIATNGKILSKHGGWYYAHFVSQHDMTLLSCGEIYAQVPIPPNAALRQLVGLKNNNYASLEVNIKTVYDRVFGGFKELAKPYIVRQGKTVLAEIKIKNPMIWRHYTEHEIINMLKRAGFDMSKTVFAHFNPAVGYPIEILPKVVSETTDPQSETCYANCFLAYHPKGK